MDYTGKTIKDLVALCKEKGVKGYSGKKRDELIALLNPPAIEPAPTEAIDASKLRMIDLFAGTGAFSHAFKSTGKVQTVFANDMVETSKKIYTENFDHPFLLKDINTVKVEDIPAHNILSGGAPCFVAGTRVLTQNGYKAIETVELSDKLFTHTGKFQRILNTQRKSGCSKIHSLDIKYHPHAIQCTEEHPFYVRERIRKWNNEIRRYEYTFKEPEWLEASKLTTEHFAGLPVNTQSIVPVHTISQLINASTSNDILVELNHPDQWFLMGYFMGDGWILDTRKPDGRLKYIINFAINNKDEEYVVRRISSILNIKDHNSPAKNCKKFGCQNQVWYSILKMFGKYAHGKQIPEWVQTAPVEYIKEFLLGYQTADGCINKSSRGIENHHVQYTTVSENIAYGIQRLYLKLGMLCSVTYCIRPPTCVIEGRTVNQRNTYKLCVTLNRRRSAISFIEDSYTWFKIHNNTTHTVPVQDVYNFEVEYDNSYCVENTIVHNCQPFSIAGKQEGFADKRSNVFWKIFEILDHHKPQCVILENVKNLVSHDEGKTFEIIKTNLVSRGYHIHYKVLDTAKLTGVPQHRERIYLVCFRSKEISDAFTLDFPEIEKRPIASFLETTVDPKYYYKEGSSTWPLLRTNVTKTDTIYQYRRVYVRENKSKECPTLTANMGGGGHNVPIIKDATGIRKLTPRECFNLQGFPADYKLPTLADSHLYKLAGNAVSVPVVKLIADRVMTLLKP